MAARELVFDIFAIDRASAVFQRVGHEAEVAGTKAGGMGGALQRGLGIAAVAIGVVGGESIKMAANFESSMTRLVTSAGESPKALEMVGQGILDLAGKVGISSDDLAKGMYVIESAGYHGADALTVLKSAAQGAKTENADLGTVANATTTIMRDFNLTAGDATKVVDTMIAAVSVGKTNFQDLSEAMHSVMPRAAALKMDFKEIAADLATMTAHGISAQQAAQNMNDLLGHLANPNKQQQKQMWDVGIDPHAVQQALPTRGLQGTVEDFSTAVMKHMGPAGLQLETVYNRSKLAAQDAGKMFDAMPAKVKAMAQQYKDGKITMHEWTQGLKDMDAPSANLLKQWAVQENSATGFADSIKKGDDVAKNYTATMYKLVGSQDGLNVALMLSGDQAGFAVDNIKKVGDAWGKSGEDVAGFDKQQETLNGKMDDAKAAAGGLAIELGQWLLPAVKTVFDWIKTGIGLIAIISDTMGGGAKSSHGLSDEMAILGITIGNNLKPILEWLKDFWKTDLWPAIQWVWGKLGDFVAWFGENAVPKLQKFADWVKSSLIPNIKDHGDTWRKVAEAVGAVVVAIEGVKIATEGISTWNSMALALKNPYVLALAAVVAVTAAIIDLYNTNEQERASIDSGLATIAYDFDTLGIAIVRVFHWVYQAITLVIEGLVHNMAVAFGWIPGGLGENLQQADKHFHDFRDESNKSMREIETKLQIDADTRLAQQKIADLHYTFLHQDWHAPLTLTADTSQVTGALSSLVISHKAVGTEHWQGGSTWVGENGPELVNLPVGSQVKDTNTSRSLAKTGAGDHPMLYIENYNEAHQSPDMIAAALMFKVRSA